MFEHVSFRRRYTLSHGFPARGVTTWTIHHNFCPFKNYTTVNVFSSTVRGTKLCCNVTFCFNFISILTSPYISMSEVIPEIAQMATDSNDADGFAFRSNFGKRRKSNSNSADTSMSSSSTSTSRPVVYDNSVDLKIGNQWRILVLLFVYFVSFKIIYWFNLWNFCLHFELIFLSSSVQMAYMTEAYDFWQMFCSNFVFKCTLKCFKVYADIFWMFIFLVTSWNFAFSQKLW